MWKTILKLVVCSLLLLLLSRFSHVRLCATPKTAAQHAPLSLGFSRQEHWSGLPFPSPMHESEKWKWSHSVMSKPQRPHGLQPTRLHHPWDFPGKSTGVGCHCLLLADVKPKCSLSFHSYGDVSILTFICLPLPLCWFYHNYLLNILCAGFRL